MTYPVDDNGNVRVDFVWGNVPMQPDEQRTDENADWNNLHNQPGDRGWGSRSYGVTSDNLDITQTQNLSIGDHDNYNDSWDDVSTRQVTVPTVHDIATTGYNNYPAFIPNYAGDGDAVLEVVMPNLVGLGSDAFVAALQAAGFSGSTGTTARYTGSNVSNNGTVFSQTPAAGALVGVETQPMVTRYVRPLVPNLLGLNIQQVGTALSNIGLVGSNTMSTDGATALNNGKVKSQAIAAGTAVDGGTTINYVLYNYVAVGPNTNVAGFSQAQFPGHQALTGNDVYMFLFGRTTKPTVGTPITLAGNSNASLNQNFFVITVEDNDSYNTGGTVVKLTAADTTLLNPGVNATNGTWINL